MSKIGQPYRNIYKKNTYHSGKRICRNGPTGNGSLPPVSSRTMNHGKDSSVKPILKIT